MLTATNTRGVCGIYGVIHRDTGRSYAAVNGGYPTAHGFKWAYKTNTMKELI